MAGAIDEKILLYADDTAILVSNKHVDVIDLKLKTGERTGLVVRAPDSGSGDPGSILGRVCVLYP